MKAPTVAQPIASLKEQSGSDAPSAAFGRSWALASLRAEERFFGLMEQLNWGYVQLGLFALAFGGLQIWWIASLLRRQRLPRPLAEREFRRTLERIWSQQQL